jgi:transketolase
VETIVTTARDTGAVVCAEEHLLHGGVGSNVARVIAEHYPAPMRFVGLADTYVESADPADLLKKYHLTSEDIVRAGREAHAARQREVA